MQWIPETSPSQNGNGTLFLPWNKLYIYIYIYVCIRIYDMPPNVKLLCHRLILITGNWIFPIDCYGTYFTIHFYCSPFITIHLVSNIQWIMPDNSRILIAKFNYDKFNGTSRPPGRHFCLIAFFSPQTRRTSMKDNGTSWMSLLDVATHNRYIMKMTGAVVGKLKLTSQWLIMRFKNYKLKNT